MQPHDPYQLLDFGNGRKLEQFGKVTIDRPCPAAEGAKRKRPRSWVAADVRFVLQGSRGHWRHEREIDSPWAVEFEELSLCLKLTAFGHLGVFPEQRENWLWIDNQVRGALRPLEVLNLFAYTGASTLVAAAAGANVTHVDAARNVNNWAQRNAELNGLEGYPIRWITEDASTFVRRELKRNRRYDAVILDPPAFGRGPKGQRWKLNDDLADLLAMCEELTAGQREFLVLTCHSDELARGNALRKFARATVPGLWRGGALEAADLNMNTADGRALNCGAVVRWARHLGETSRRKSTSNQVRVGNRQRSAPR